MDELKKSLDPKKLSAMSIRVVGNRETKKRMARVTITRSESDIIGAFGVLTYMALRTRDAFLRTKTKS